MFLPTHKKRSSLYEDIIPRLLENGWEHAIAGLVDVHPIFRRDPDILSAAIVEGRGMKKDDRKLQFAYKHHVAAFALGHLAKARLFRRQGAAQLRCEQCGERATVACHCGSTFCSDCPQTHDGPIEGPYICGCGEVACFYCALSGGDVEPYHPWGFCTTCKLASCFGCFVFGDPPYFRCSDGGWCRQVDCFDGGVESDHWMFEGCEEAEGRCAVCEGTHLEAERAERRKRRLAREKQEEEDRERKRGRKGGAVGAPKPGRKAYGGK